jgi:BON domain-containing protein
MRIRTAILAAAAGAAAAYLFDPTSGGPRRRRLRSMIAGMIPRRPSTPDDTPLPENLAPTASSSRDVVVSRAPTGPMTPAPRPDRPARDVAARPGAAIGGAGVPSAIEGEDARIAGDVRAKLRRRPDLGADELVIDVVNGVAYLSGDLHDQHTFGEVVDLTRDVPGVRRVQSLLHLPPSETIPGATVRTSDDEDTT